MAPKRRRLFLVELFAGSHSVSRAVKKHYGTNFDVRVLSVDKDPESRPTVVADINAWRYQRDIDAFLRHRKRLDDVVVCWTSPPCTAFSRANTTGVRDILGGSQNVKSGLRIVRYSKPTFWFQDNPVGLLKDQPFMARFKKYINTCCYCRYGRLIKKPTNIWSNVPLDLKICDQQTPCAAKRKHGRHLVTSQKGPSRSVRGSHTSKRVYPIPSKLVRHLFRNGLEYALSGGGGV